MPRRRLAISCRLCAPPLTTSGYVVNADAVTDINSGSVAVMEGSTSITTMCASEARTEARASGVANPSDWSMAERSGSAQCSEN